MKTLGKIVLWALVVIAAIAVVGWLALRRPDIPFARLEAKYAAAAADKYVDLPGGLHVHYRDQGNPAGPTLVMVHGYSASFADWEPWVKLLGDRYRILTLDLPGQGLTRSPADYKAWPDGYVQVVDQVTEKVGARRFVLIGNSMGGMVSWSYALAHPEKLDGLVLVDSAGWALKPNGALIFKLLQNPAAAEVIKDLDNRAMIKQGLQAAFLDPKLVDDALVDRYTELSRAPGHRDILIHLQEGRVEATKEKLATIKVPTLVMHGKQDQLIPVQDGERFAQAIPNATLIEYDNVGHVPMEQIPEKSAADLRRWLEAKVYPSPLAGEGGLRSRSDEGFLKPR
ncbi:MAG: alpha/beta fold hydrolase [Ignavibacteriales bacterium]